MPIPDPDLPWRKSTHSGGAQQCVEVARAPDGAAGCATLKLPTAQPTTSHRFRGCRRRRRW